MRATFTARTLALVAVMFLGCNPSGGEGPSQLSTQQAPLSDSSGEQAAEALALTPLFRYGHVTWRPVGPRVAEFSVVSAFRRVYSGSGPDGLAVTGDTFQESSGATRLCFGDGTCTGTLTYQVTSYDAAQGWVLAQASGPLTHTYASDGPFTAGLSGCCRIAELGNPNTDYLVQTSVRFTLDNSSPVSSLPPVVDAPVNTEGFSFQLPATDAEGDQLSFRLATGGESSLWSPPAGLTVSSTGRVSWSTVGAAVGQLWAAQVIIEERREGVLIGSSAVDFLLRVTGSASSNLPPVANAGPDQTVSEGATVSLNGGGSGDTEGSALTYHWALMSSTGPAVTLSSTSSAAPSFTARDDGLYTFLLTVTDSQGATGSDTVLVRVINAVPQVRVSTPNPALDEDGVFLGSGSFSDPGADSWSASVDYGDGSGSRPLPLDNGTFSLRHHYTDSGAFQARIFVTDDDGGVGTFVLPVRVRNVAPVFVSLPSRFEVFQGEQLSGAATFRDPGLDAWQAWVDFGDGNLQFRVPLQKALSFTHAYRLPGTYTITLTVLDDDGGEVTAAIPVVVRNVTPSVSVAGEQVSLSEGGEFIAVGSFSDPAIGTDTFTLTVDYGDGAGPQPLSSVGSRLALRHHYSDNGAYTVTVTVTDGFGGVGTASMQVAVANVAPGVHLSSWGYAEEGSPVQLEAIIEDPGSADTLTATVDYGDGSPVQPVEVNGNPIELSHVYADDGQYLVTLTVTDDDGEVGTASAPVEVFNAAPLLAENMEAQSLEGAMFHFPGAFTDPGTDTWQARVDYGDGQGFEPLPLDGQSFQLAHRYLTRGSYRVVIEVSDEDGGAGYGVVQVTVANVLPALTVRGGEALEGSKFTGSGTFIDPGDEASTGWTAQVDYGDGTGWQAVELNGSSFLLEHTYQDSGVFTVTVVVHDGEGASTATAQAVIHNVAPAVVSSGGSINEGSDFITRAYVTEPSPADQLMALIDYGDGSPVETRQAVASELQLQHRYADNGTYVVTISVLDDDGGIGTATVSVLVRNVAPSIIFSIAGQNEGSAFTGQGTVADVGADSWTVTVNHGDGSPPEQVFPAPGAPQRFFTSHVYDDNGFYEVTVTVTDDDGGVTTRKVMTFVRNVVPKVLVSNDSPRPWGVPIHFVSTVTDPSQADTQAGFTGRWTMGDGATPSGLTLAYAYAVPGIYSVRLLVRDKDGGSAMPNPMLVSVQKRPAAVTCANTTAVFGFPVALSARFVDGLPGGLPEGRGLSFRLGGSTDLGAAITDASGLASVQSPGLLMPGTYALTVTFAEDSHYTAAQASCTLTVTQSTGTLTGGGLRFPNKARGGFNVTRAETGSPQGELQFQHESNSFHSRELTALGLSADRRQGWFAGVTRDGRAFIVYVEDNGEPGSHDIFKLWLDGVPQTADGVLSGGNIQIH